VAQCAQLGNIAALNGNTITTGGSSSGSGNINNGQQFMNQCATIGSSINQCAQLLNIAILNGNNVNLSGLTLAQLTALAVTFSSVAGVASALPLAVPTA